ncbi:group III truncated hemoglobin [Membranihabitans maritimus]|uniref:group III truncated hemoglobin n=1 Tax=Membranihabitans maritimus TaxID=2904244 RepID=UPI001F3FC18F|nr:group III truncated hemoglobin [Membranihabitans maritimus]
MTDYRPDIHTENDIKLMVDSFYEKVNNDPVLSPIFNDFAQVEWDSHLPVMYRFWNTLIFANQTYKGNPFGVHIPLPIDKKHFDRWIELFEKNIDELFEGPVANNTKERARSIAMVFESKLKYIK